MELVLFVWLCSTQWYIHSNIFCLLNCSMWHTSWRTYCVPKQWNGGHFGVPNLFRGNNWILLLCKRLLLFWLTCSYNFWPCWLKRSIIRIIGSIQSPGKIICHKFQKTETLLFSHIAYRFLWRSLTAWSRGDEVLVFSLLQVPTEGPFYLKLEHLLKRRTQKNSQIFTITLLR